MAKLQIGSNTVQVDDSFLKLSPDDQQSTVDEISKSFASQPSAPAAAPYTIDQSFAQPDMVQNAKTLYKSAEGKDFSGSDADAATYAKNYLKDFNYRLVGANTNGARGTIDTAVALKNYSPEGKKAFMDLSNNFDNASTTAGGVLDAAKRVATDPTTYLGIGTGGGAEVAGQVAKVGAKQALSTFLKNNLVKTAAKGAAEGAVYSGVSDIAHQGADMNADGQQNFDYGQLAKSAGMGAATGGAVGAAVHAVPAAASAVGNKLHDMNQLPVTYPEAAQAVAGDLKNLNDTGGYNLKDVSSSNQGAKGAITKASVDNTSIIKDRASKVADLLGGDTSSMSADDIALRQKAGLAINSSQDSVDAAEQALVSGKQKTATHATPDQIDAVHQLVGHTQQGDDLVHALQKHVELNRLYDNIHGGVSKYTDVLNPLADSGSKLIDTGARRLALGGGLFYGAQFHPLSALGAAAIPIAGNTIDAITGRKSLPNLFMKQNIGKAARVTDPALTDVIAQASAKSQAEVAAKATTDAAVQQAKDTARTQAALDKFNSNKAASDAKVAKAADAQTAKNTAIAAAAQKQQATAAIDELNRKMTVQANINNVPYSNINTGKIVNPPPVVKAPKAPKAPPVAADPSVASAKAPSNVLKDSNGNAIRNLPNYQAKVNAIKSIEQNITDTAASHKNPQTAKLLNSAVEAFKSDRGKGIDDQGKFSKANRAVNRANILDEIVKQGSNPTQKGELRKHLTPLKDVFK